MGGALTLYLAARNPDKVKAIAPMAAPVKLKLGLRKLLQPLKYTNLFIPYREYTFKDERIKNNALLQYIRRNYGKLPVKNMFQLIDLIKMIGKELPLITQPALIIQSKYDDVVPRSNPHIIYDKINSSVKKLLWVENSYHVLVADNDRDLINNAILDFFNTYLR